MGRPFDERAFHRWLARRLDGGPRALVGPGDDVAVVRLGGQGLAVLTTDALAEPSHFRRASDPRAVGACAAGVSLSDLASKGAEPIAGLLDLLLPADTPAAWARAVVEGAERASALHGAHIVGGDTKAAAGRAIVSTFLGRVATPTVPRRSGARPGDALVVTGTTGRGGAAALALRSSKPSRRALDAMLRVEPRVEEGRRLAPFAHAMIDTSDGLADAARLVAAASRARLILDDDRIPWATGLERLEPRRRREVGFYGGDYELLAAVLPATVPRAITAVNGVGGALTVVGEVRAGSGAWIWTGHDRPAPLPSAGWDPFRPRAP